MPPYHSNSQLPPEIRKLPTEAQEIYRGAYNRAWQEHSRADKRAGGLSRHQASDRIAWAAVNKEFRKDHAKGKWERMG